MTCTWQDYYNAVSAYNEAYRAGQITMDQLLRLRNDAQASCKAGNMPSPISKKDNTGIIVLGLIALGVLLLSRR